MTTNETTPQQEVDAKPADELYLDLQSRRRDLDDNHDSLEAYGIKEPARVVWEQDGRHEHVSFDLSDQPGGSFKYASAAGALCTAQALTTAVTRSAGNYGSGLAYAAQIRNVDTVVYAPDDLTAPKHATMHSAGATVVQGFDDVAAAAPAVAEACQRNRGWRAFEPFNEHDGVAALTILTDGVIGHLLKMEADDSVDLRDRPVKIPVQRGGGSLLAAMTVSVRSAQEAGLIGDNVSVIDVRPATEMDPMFDGLRVAEPGSIAATFLADERYVAGRHAVSQEAVADSARVLQAFAPDVPYESNALAGVGASLEMRKTDPQPTLYVTLLSGRNATPAQHKQLLKAPGLQTQEMSAPARNTSTRSVVWNGLTAAHRAYAPRPAERPQEADDPHIRPQNWQEYDEMVGDEDITLVLLPRFRS